MKTKQQQVANFLKKTKKYHTAPKVAEIIGCSVVYVYANDEWKNHRGRFDKGTVDERVHECLEKYGKTLPSLNTIAEECGCAVESAQRAPSYRERRVKPPSKKEKIENFLRSVWDDSKRYKLQEVADKCGCSREYVSRLNIWGRYYRRFKQQGDANATGQSNSLSKPKENSKSTIQNRARTLLFHKNGKPKLNKSTRKKFKLKEVLEFFGCSRGAFRTVWRKYQSSFPKQEPAGKRIKEALFYNNGKPKLSDETGKPFTQNEIALKAKCSVATVKRYKKGLEKYLEKTQAFRPQGTTEERVKKALQELCAEGIVNPTLPQVSARAECSEVYIYRYSSAWKAHRQSLVASPPPIFTATSGKGNTKTASAVLEEYQTWIEEAILAPVKELAERNNICFICVNHDGKADQATAAQKALGATSIMGKMRIAYTIKKELGTPTNGEYPLHTLAASKFNIGRRPKGITYRIVECPDDPEIGKVEILDIEGDFTADDKHDMGEGENKFEQCCLWLQTFLSNGAVLQSEVKVSANRAGHSEATLYRAKRHLGVKSRKQKNFSGQWEWYLCEGVQGHTCEHAQPYVDHVDQLRRDTAKTGISAFSTCEHDQHIGYEHLGGNPPFGLPEFAAFSEPESTTDDGGFNWKTGEQTTPVVRCQNCLHHVPDTYPTLGVCRAGKSQQDKIDCPKFTLQGLVQTGEEH